MGLDLIARLISGLREPPVERVGEIGQEYARLDLGREQRTGIPEIVYGAGKTPEQIAGIMSLLHQRLGRALATRVSADTWSELKPMVPGARYHVAARTVCLGDLPLPEARVLVVWSGPSERAVAAETAETLRFFALDPVEHRAPVSVDAVGAVTDKQDCRLVIVLAGERPGMVSVIAGLTRCPVIAVPVNTGSVGNLEGVSPLLVCLASCAPGIGVVNIDSGFGAAALARKIVLGSSSG